MAVNEYLVAAFAEAFNRHRQIAQAWTTISPWIGGRLPHSLLMVSIQREGRVDVVLRCLEDECAAYHARRETPKNILIFDHLRTLSDYWLSAMYETFRLLQSRGLADKGEAFASIFHELELVRMGIDKHEIPKDQKLVEPLAMVRVPALPHDKEGYIYDKNDPKRGHIMPMGMSERGSPMWQVIDHLADRSFWIERCNLSDRMLDLWKDAKPARAGE